MQQVENIERARYGLEMEMDVTPHPALPHLPGKQRSEDGTPHPAAPHAPGKQRSSDGTPHPGLPRGRS